MISASETHLGMGLYSVGDAARIVRAPYNNVRRWLDPQTGIISRQFDPSEHTVSFTELMELHFIKLFRDQGVTLQAIRKAARAASARFDTDYPFAVKRFDTDGKTIFATLAKECDNQEIIEDLARGQYVFTTIIRPFFKKLDYDSAEVSRYWPLTKKNRVVLDPLRQFGRPIDAETGVPTSALYNALRAGGGQSVGEVAKWFDVPESAVRAAAEFERSLQ